MTRRPKPREEILAAAAHAVAKDGYHGMSMRDLARDTGRSLAGLYAHFESKEAILFELQSGAFQSLIDGAERALAVERDPERRLHAFVLNHVRHFADHPDLMRVLILEASTLPPARRAAVRALKERYFRIGRDVLNVLVELGRGALCAGANDAVDEKELERVTYTFFGMLNWIWGWYEPRRHGSSEELARTIERVALCGMVAGFPQRGFVAQVAAGGAP